MFPYTQERQVRGQKGMTDHTERLVSGLLLLLTWNE